MTVPSFALFDVQGDLFPVDRVAGCCFVHTGKIPIDWNDFDLPAPEQVNMNRNIM
jgi:hypothetical protein